MIVGVGVGMGGGFGGRLGFTFAFRVGAAFGYFGFSGGGTDSVQQLFERSAAKLGLEHFGGRVQRADDFHGLRSSSGVR